MGLVMMHCTEVSNGPIQGQLRARQERRLTLGGPQTRGCSCGNLFNRLWVAARQYQVPRHALCEVAATVM